LTLVERRFKQITEVEVATVGSPPILDLFQSGHGSSFFKSSLKNAAIDTAYSATVFNEPSLKERTSASIPLIAIAAKYSRLVKPPNDTLKSALLGSKAMLSVSTSNPTSLMAVIGSFPFVFIPLLI